MAVERSLVMGRFEAENGIGVVEDRVFVHPADDRETKHRGPILLEEILENGTILTGR